MTLIVFGYFANYAIGALIALVMLITTAIVHRKEPMPHYIILMFMSFVVFTICVLMQVSVIVKGI